MERTCPLGHTCNACIWQTQVLGTNPQTGETVNETGCAIAFLPMLLIENSKQSRETGAAVESLRNTIVKQSQLNREANRELAMAAEGQPLAPPAPAVEFPNGDVVYIAKEG